MIIQTGRFGELKTQDTGGDNGVIHFPEGVLGFQDERDFCLVDPGDDTLILWLQSIRNPHLAFPVLEPRIFDSQFVARISAAEQRALKLENLKRAAVYSILTIPDDITQMTANLKAPVVINLETGIGKQVVLQENNYSVRHPMFKELRAHLITIESATRAATGAGQESVGPEAKRLGDIIPATGVPLSLMGPG